MESEHKFQTIINENPDITLTIRLIMQGKEVGSIIGKKGEIVKRFREQSGAKINICDGSCPERIVSVTGTIGQIYKAFSLICKKFEVFQDNSNNKNAATTSTTTQPKPSPITLRLIVPASQCGSLIGKGGAKIKEIREITGVSIQVASEMLPNSTERAVTITGICDAIIQCIYHISMVMLESPPKGATIPYRPKQSAQIGNPVILAGGQAYTIQGNYAVPTSDITALNKNPLGLYGLSGLVPSLAPPPPPSPANSAAAVAAAAAAAAINPAALAALAGSQLRAPHHPHPHPHPHHLHHGQQQLQQNTATNQHQHHEMIVPNELIGCVIGKGGTKIAEIRQISGAIIRISNCDERDNAGTSGGGGVGVGGAGGVTGGGGSFDRTITISGNAEAVNLAQYLINMRISMETIGLPAGLPNLAGLSASGAGCYHPHLPHLQHHYSIAPNLTL